ncbi:MAG: vitamin B12-dependent ribonucleotide reductase [Dehalococcoidia bacterium]|nr:vitamin B12-dependent ribonucleotide reductase [Dehalococcoidia bacterium]
MASDPLVRAALQQAVAALEATFPSPFRGGGQVERSKSAEEGRKRVLAALTAAGLTAEPPDLPFSENALTVLKARYLRRNDQGEVVETPEGMLHRVALAIAKGDKLYNPTANVEAAAEKFYRIMAKLDFLPNSPTMMNAGTGAGTLSACFVLPLQDSLESIMETAHDTAMVQKYGGGTGFALSELRPKGAPIATTHGRACGPIAVLRHLSSVSTMITQGGKRDGANMAVMDVHHPDILEFITCKEQEGQIHNFNISVGVDEEFMQAVKDGGRLELRDPKGGVVVKTEDAREVFQKIVDGAWRNGEPGMIFLDRVNQDNPTPHLGQMTATNPCGEQPLLPYESCNLGSINMARMLRYSSPLPFREGGQGVRSAVEGEAPVEIDWDRLRATVWTAVHFLDNVIDVNRYSVPGVERMTKLTRKVGLGVMGFADMLVRLSIPYDSEEGLELGRQVMRFIRDEADKASVELAKERGVFPAFKGSRHDRPGGLRLRNSCRLTVAPTGTISMIAGCSSGIEPIFALAYRKHNILEGKTLYYTDAAFEAAARHHGFWSDGLVESLSQGASLKDRDDVPAWAQRVFATAPDIAPDWHVRMQAVFQESTDAAISKTINFPNAATEDDVRTAYLLAWELGCKGITVYRAGSREKEVLTAGTKQGAQSPKSAQSADSSPADASPILRPRERPQVMRGLTERVRTAYGNMYVTITFDDNGRPFEAFATLGKAGGTDSANLEAVARLVSMSLRSGVAPEEVVEQLRGITSEPVWDQGVLVRSAPDAVAIALSRAIERVRSGELGMALGAASARGLEAEQPALFSKDAVAPGAKEPFAAAYRSASLGAAGMSSPVGRAPGTSARAGWIACPKCSGPLVMQEGCETCRECGFSRCG